MIIKINRNKVFPKIAMGIFIFLALLRSFNPVIFKNSVFMYMVVIAVLYLLVIDINGPNRGLKINRFNIFTMLTIVPLVFNNIYFKNGYHLDGFLFIATICLIFLLQCYNLTDKDFVFIKKIFIIYALICTAVTWYSFIFPNLYLKTIVPLFSPEDQNIIKNDFINNKMLMGLANHYSRNAYYITLGCIACCSNMIVNSEINGKRYKNRIIMLVLTTGMFLVAKRGHAIFLVISLIGAYFVMTKIAFDTFIKLLFKGIAVIALLFLIIRLIPGADNLITRLSNSNNVDVSTGRFFLYQNVWSLYQNNNYHAIGWGAFAASTDYFYAGVHNDYLQLLCETGIWGLIIFLISNFYNLYVAIKLLKSEKINCQYKSILFFSLTFQIFFVTYSLTGLPHYDYEVFMIYLIFSAVPWIIRNKLFKER